MQFLYSFSDIIKDSKYGEYYPYDMQCYSLNNTKLLLTYISKIDKEKFKLWLEDSIKNTKNILKIFHVSYE